MINISDKYLNLNLNLNLNHNLTLTHYKFGINLNSRRSGVLYLEALYNSYGFDKGNMAEVKQILMTNYNGYRFLPDTHEAVYNSTILNYFFKKFALD